MDAKTRYLDLLKKSLLEELYVENEVRLLYLRACLARKEKFREDVYLDISRKWKARFDEYVRLSQHGMAYGKPMSDLGFQHTMISRKRLENIEACMGTILAENVPGDVIECGVWRGGATIFMRGFLAAHGPTDRTVWVADSFQGLPRSTAKADYGIDMSASTHPMLAIDLETVQDNFRRYGLLDDQVRFLPGWFKDTLPTAPIDKLALLRLDGDLYSSTMETLEALYDKVSLGGFVIVDDYGCMVPCRQAVMDFRSRMGISEPMHEVDWTAIYWRRTR